MNNTFRSAAFAGLGKDCYSFSYAGPNGIVRSEVKGIGRLISLADKQFDLSGGYVCDRVVGKAAALLMIYLGAKNVYAGTISKPAFEAFRLHGVKVLYTSLVPAIINRTGDDICPMEKAVLDTDCPDAAYQRLKQR